MMWSAELQTPAAGGLSRPTGSDRARRAFTLFEVMAAVAILSIWYLIIANAAVQGLRAEGRSLRRLEAAQLADRTLADIETSMLDGSVPEIQDESAEEGDFVVKVKVAHMRGQPRLLEQGLAEDGKAAKSTGLRELLQMEIPGVSKHLYRITVHVVWTEAGAKQQLLRTTYGFDRRKASEAFRAMAEGGAAGGESGLSGRSSPPKPAGKP